MIDSLFAIRKGLRSDANKIATTVPEGCYAIKGLDGSIDLYQVDRPTQGQYAGNTYVKLLVGAPGSYREMRQTTPQAKAVLATVELDPEGAARLFGQVTETCGHCSSPLSNNQSLMAGYGGTCAANHGYWYPGKAEADAWAAEQLASCGKD